MVTGMEVHFVNRVFDKSNPPRSSLELVPFLFPALGQHDLDEAHLDVKVLNQGTTNGLFKVSLRASDFAPILIKVYGEGTEITIDRNKELKVHKLLSEKRLSSSPLVRFVNGHAYQFISGIVCSERTITEPTIWRGVARELARWHATLPDVKPTSDNSLEVLHLESSIWSTTGRWLDAIPSEPQGSAANKGELVEAFEYLKRQLLFSGGAGNPLVLGHGDLLCANIIVQDVGRANGLKPPAAASVRFIDYEHATYCPREFELANHFSEWAGFECDYTLLPTKTTRRGFICEYLQTYASLTHSQPRSNGSTAPPIQYQVAEAEVEELMDRVDAFRGLPGFYWGLCAVIQAEASTGSIDFDYSGYAEKRFAEYRAWRNAEDRNAHCQGDLGLREERWASP